MIVQVATFLLAAALGQAAPDAGWLKSVPAEADVVVRVRGVDAARDDLAAMLRALSPALAQQAVPAIEQAVELFTTRFTKDAARCEILAFARVVPPEQPGRFPFAIVVHEADHQAVLKAVVDETADRKDEGNGLVSFPGIDGNTWYGAPGEGVTVFGPDRGLVTAAANPAEKNLASTLGDNSSKLLAGDLGVYVNLAALVSRYETQIDAARQQFMTLLDAAGQQAGNRKTMDMVKGMYGKLFDGLKLGDGLVLNLDFDAKGLEVDGIATVKPDTKAARHLARAGATTGYESLAKLPANSSYFIHLDMNGELLTRMQNISMSMLFPDGEPTPEMEAALKAFKELGRLRTDSAAGFGDGFENFSLTQTDNAEGLIAATHANVGALKAVRPDSPNFVKGVEITDNAETHRGITFSRSEVTFDLDKLIAMSGPSSNKAMLEGMFGGDAIRTWYGIHDKAVLTITAKDWETAKARVDSYLDGKGSLGETASYKAITERLPKSAALVGLLSVQGLLKQLATQFAAISRNPNLKVPGDLPAEPVLMGGALQPAGNGIQFKAVIPSAIGPVFEKGLPPLLQGLQGVQGQ